jgi:hypothetical protein
MLPARDLPPGLFHETQLPAFLLQTGLLLADCSRVLRAADLLRSASRVLQYGMLRR